MSSIILKKGGFRPEDINQIVAIHREQINEGFLSSLGDEVLKLVFENIAESKNSFLITAVDTSQSATCGFLCGTGDVRKLYSDFIVKRFFRAGFHLIPKLISLERIKKTCETLIYPLKGNHVSVPRAEFLDFALKAEYQGTGLAQRMFYEAVNIYHSMGVKEFKSPVNEQLIASQRFHEKLGARKAAYVQIHKGQNSIVYVFDVPTLMCKENCLNSTPLGFL